MSYLFEYHKHTTMSRSCCLLNISVLSYYVVSSFIILGQKKNLEGGEGRAWTSPWIARQKLHHHWVGRLNSRRLVGALQGRDDQNSPRARSGSRVKELLRIL